MKHPHGYWNSCGSDYLAVTTPFPRLGDGNVGTIEGGNGWTPEQPQRAVQIGTQHLDRALDPALPVGWTPEQPQGAVQLGTQDPDPALDPGFTGCGQAVGIGTATEHGAGAEANRLDDVGAPANTPVHQDLDLSIHRGDHLRQ